METPHERLKWARSQRYETAADFARALEIPEPTYRSHESGTRGFKENAAKRYAKALGVSWAWLMTGTGEPATGGQLAMTVTNEHLPRDADLATIHTAAIGPRDLPVYASAEGGPSGMVVISDPIDWISRPGPLMNVKGAFAVYVIGDSMEPAYEQGDMILVNPSKPVSRGDDVLFTRQLDGEMAALIKRVVKWTDSAWTVRQYNPPKEYELPRADWPGAQVIIGKYNRK